MNPVDPNTAKNIVGPDCYEVTFAKDQPQYLPLPTIVTPDGRVVSQWQPTPGELALLNNGVPLTLEIWHGPLTPDNLLRPVRLSVGGVDLS